MTTTIQCLVLSTRPGLYHALKKVTGASQKFNVCEYVDTNEMTKETLQDYVQVKDGLVSFSGAEVVVGNPNLVKHIIVADESIIGFSPEFKWFHSTFAGVEAIVDTFRILRCRNSVLEPSLMLTRYGTDIHLMMIIFLMCLTS